MSDLTLSTNSINALIWTFDAVAIIATGGRLYIRGRVIKRLGWDDAVHVLAAVCMVIQSGMYTGAAPLLEAVTLYLAKKTTVVPDFVKYLQINIANTVITFTCYWLVKLSIMLFYRKLFSVSDSFMRAWWAVLAFVFASYLVVIITSLVQCGGNGTKITDLAICASEASAHLDRKIFKISFAMNISSDLFIMALPLAKLPKLRMGIREKFGVGLIFSLTWIIIAMEIVRLDFSLGGKGSSSNIVWTSTEASLAIIISCLPSFSALINYREKGRTRAATEYDRLAATRATNKTHSAKDLTKNRSNKSVNGASEEIPLVHLNNV